MAATVELLITQNASDTALAMLKAMRTALISDGMSVEVTQKYRGLRDLLMLHGVGAPDRNAARNAHVASGRRVIMWDMGYFGRKKTVGYLRCSIDRDHPQAWFDRTPADAGRWQALRIALRDDARPDGPVILVGLGRKSRSYLRADDWEAARFDQLRSRFPGREIIYRPKPGNPWPALKCKTDATTPIEALLIGASLVSCRHSNVACDAAVAGVPFECDDGAAVWLQPKPYTTENRTDFLHRLAHWQYRPDEAANAWHFLKGMLRAS